MRNALPTPEEEELPAASRRVPVRRRGLRTATTSVLNWIVGTERSSQIVTLKVPAELDYRELVTRAVALACKVATSNTHPENSEYREQLTHELVSAVGEAFNNIVLHGYCASERGEVGIVTSVDGNEMRVELLDSGKSFDPGAVKPPDLSSLPESGMGLYIIRSFVDVFEYEPGNPNVTRLTKYIAKA